MPSSKRKAASESTTATKKEKKAPAVADEEISPFPTFAHPTEAEARAVHKAQTEGNSALVAKERSQADLSEMLREAMAKLWERPYDCRVFTLQLLQSLAQLDDASLCMMASCFSRYLENHSVPA